MVPANSCKIPRVPHYSGARSVLCLFAYATITLFGRLFHTFPLRLWILCFWSHDPTGASPDGLGFSAFARRYLRNHCCFLFLWVLRWFTSPGWLLLPYEFRKQFIGFPHSDIDGSMDKCSSPSLFAAFHVLHRLQVPRHSPHALSSLTIKLIRKQSRYQDPPKRIKRLDSAAHKHGLLLAYY